MQKRGDFKEGEGARTWFQASKGMEHRGRIAGSSIQVALEKDYNLQ